MRPTLTLIFLLAACSRQPAEPQLTTGSFAGAGRDRLCIAGGPGAYRGGVIAFAASGDSNCSASGKLEPASGGWALVPKGEGECRIPLLVEGNVVSIGQLPAACSYYCAPGASLAGKKFNRSDMGATVADLAGDPLC